MPVVKFVTLSDSERRALEEGFRHGSTHSFRQRCHIILLKSEERTSADVASHVGCCEPVVNTCLKRYKAEGIAGLHHKKGGGRHSILNKETDLSIVRRAVQANRQRVSLARAELEKELGKPFSTLTLKRFLKKTVAASNDCESE